MKRTWLVIVGLGMAACRGEEEPLPEPKTILTLQPALPCGGTPPPPPPFPLVADSPTDLGTCLGASFPHDAIPVIVTVAPDGTARPGLTFYSQCTGETFAVDEPTQRCLEERLSHWRWLPLHHCPELAIDLEYFATAERPRRAAARRVVAGRPQWTGEGCVG
jgi:hypothetical protein